jgi:hypothetical protein
VEFDWEWFGLTCPKAPPLGRFGQRLVGPCAPVQAVSETESIPRT